VVASSPASGGGTGNVKVCVRFRWAASSTNGLRRAYRGSHGCFEYFCRPQNTVEKESGGFWTVDLADEVVKVKDPSSFHGTSNFNFDRVFSPESSQKDVYEFVGRYGTPRGEAA
jgi:hypothetical protein